MNASRTPRRAALAALPLLLLTGCPEDAGKAAPGGQGGADQAELHRDKLAEQAKATFGPLPDVMESPANPLTPEKVALGRMLYYDGRLSKSHEISCNTCHELDSFGDDGRAVAVGHRKQPGKRNSPTVYNAGVQFAQFWDFRAVDLEEQAKGPILNPIEMGMVDAPSVLKVLASIPGYVDAFKAAFPGEAEPISYDNLGRAIGAFERTLTTPSRFDDFMNGKLDALSDAEATGLQTFMEVGCIACHTGPGVGGSLSQRMGLVKPYETDDRGRAEVTDKDADLRVFKVPLLRNVTKTGPYFHDGSVDSLQQAVQIMGEHQLGKSLTSQQVEAIVAFLGALEGRIPEDRIKKPELPPNGPNTPAPDPN